MSHCVRKPTKCLGENKGADQLRGNREADQRLCFRYADSRIPLLLKSKFSSFKPASVTVQPGLCQTWSISPNCWFSQAHAHIILFFKTFSAWRLAYRVYNGSLYTWNSVTLYGHNSLWDLFLSTDSHYPSDPSSYEPFKSSVIQDWADNKISVQAVSRLH